MIASFRMRMSMMLIGALAVALVGLVASRALACTPEGYQEELRVAGELPGGG
jgi:hypothetical protein